MNARTAAVEELERRIGHTFADRDLLERALTHASVGGSERKAKHNQRLEFLGDRILNLIVAEELMNRLPDAPEGDLSRAYHQLVNYHACAEVARQAGLSQALRFGGGAAKLGMRENDRVLGDACEALIAALYLDAGMAAAKAFVVGFWNPTFDSVRSGLADPKSRLQEWAGARGLALPVYELLKTGGSAHAPVFTVQVSLADRPPSAAKGGSKREAEKLAAAALLERLESEP